MSKLIIVLCCLTLLSLVRGRPLTEEQITMKIANENPELMAALDKCADIDKSDVFDFMANCIMGQIAESKGRDESIEKCTLDYLREKSTTCRKK